MDWKWTGILLVPFALADGPISGRIPVLEILLFFFWPGILMLLSITLKSFLLSRLNNKHERFWAKLSLVLFLTQVSWFVILFVFGFLISFFPPG
ncbi:hypothetical protein K8R43_03125 [archaeon]|nr:hypothetical protein [archaeon]